MRLLVRWLLAALALMIATPPAGAFDAPGLDRDASAYTAALRRGFPTGASTAQRAAAEAQADSALKAGDLDKAVAALETRIGQGQTEPWMFVQLARAQLRRAKPDPARAAQAALLAFNDLAPWRGHKPEERLPVLLLLADAMHALDRPASEISALRDAIELNPDDKALAARLAETERAAGMLVRNTDIERDSDPARVCLLFTVPPTDKRDFQPADWVRLDPPLPDAAITLEGEQICVSGLPPAKTTTIVLRAGLPAQGGATLHKETRLPVAMPNRQPGVTFDSRFFVLPRFQPASVTVSTVNISTVALKIIRLSERNVGMLLRRVKLGESLDYWNANNLGEEAGSEIWSGKADIPGFADNRTIRTTLPLPEALMSAGPGIFALLVTQGDGTQFWQGGVQLILRTDLAPTVWRGNDGLTVQTRDYATAKTRPDVLVRLLAQNNDIIAEARADAEGLVRFPVPLLRGPGGQAPAALHLFADNGDFATLDLHAAAFDLSDRGVTGMAPSGPIDAFAWTDRGIYRPGETVNVMALLRDAAGAPLDLPSHVIVRKPNGTQYLDVVPPRLAGGAIHAPIALASSAAAGMWSLEIKADPAAEPIFQTEFRVDAFLPERLAVDTGTLPAALVPGEDSTIPLTARFLYGAVGSGLTGHATLRLIPDPQPSPALAGAAIGQEGEIFAPDQSRIELPVTDAAGKTEAIFNLGQAPDTTQALKAEIDIAIDDPSGHASHARVTLPVRPAGPLIGIKPRFADRAVNANSEAGFDIAAVGPDGSRIALPVRLRLVRERPDWRLVTRGGTASYQTVWRDEPLETRDVTLQPGDWFRFARALPFGRYRLEAAQSGGLALTTLRFRSGWADSSTPDVPDKVDVSTDRKMAKLGEAVRVHITPPFAGLATVAVLTDRVHSVRNIELPVGGADIDVTVDAAWGPGAYVTVHAYRPAPNTARAIGVAYIAADPSERQLPLVFETPSLAAPRQTQEVVLRTAPGAMVSLAAVDEGILRLTRFTTPDPAPHFLGRRRLGIDIRDDWGRLIPPPDGPSALLRQGGDDSYVLPDIPQRILSLFTPPVAADADGVVRIRLDLPDFAGQARLMAVAWQARRFAAADTQMTIRDPLVAEALLPRFLAPGDEAVLPVLLQNLDLPGGKVTARLTVEGPLTLTGPAELSIDLAKGDRAMPATGLRTTGVGRGVVKLAITGPGGFQVARESAITVRPSRSAQSSLASFDLPPGGERRLDPESASYLPAGFAARLTAGAPVRYDAEAMRAALAEYDYFCLEQASSKVLALSFTPANPGRLGQLQEAVQRILDKQRYDGAFGLWSGNGEAEPWLSLYAIDTLMRARDAGVAVPPAALASAMKLISAQVSGNGDNDEGPRAPSLNSYRLYLLARAGQGQAGAARVLLEKISTIPTAIARAQLGAALALAHDRARAETAFEVALRVPAREWAPADYGSALRDQLALIVLLRESGIFPDRLPGLVAKLPGGDLKPAQLNTQDLAWAAAADGALRGGPVQLNLTLDGTPLASDGRSPISEALTAPAVLRNAGEKPVWVSIARRGVPVQPPVAAHAGLTLTARFVTPDGKPLDPANLKQNTLFVLLIEGKMDGQQRHTLAISQGLPAGWEIAARVTAPTEETAKVSGMPWLDRLSRTDAQPAADDRFAAIVSLDAKQRDFRVAVRLRATTQGSFALPGAEAADMYRPAIAANLAETKVRVAAP